MLSAIASVGSSVDHQKPRRGLSQLLGMSRATEHLSPGARIEDIQPFTPQVCGARVAGGEPALGGVLSLIEANDDFVKGSPLHFSALYYFDI